MRKRKSNKDIKIDVIEYSIMHNKPEIIKTMRKKGYKGRTDNDSIYNAIKKFTKKNKEKALVVLAELHPDYDLIAYRVEMDAKKSDTKSADAIADVKEEVEKKYLRADGDENENESKPSAFKVDITSVVVGTILALGLIIVIKQSIKI